MKKIKVLILVMSVFFLVACENNKKTGENVKDELISHKSDALKELSLKNQNEINTWREKDPTLPKGDNLDAVITAAQENKDRLGSVPVEIADATYYGGESLDAKVLFADNIFVATVEDMETFYFGSEENTKVLETAIPTMTFKLKVIENIKGELPTEKVIRASRDYFGLKPDQKSFLNLIDGDTIPEKGKTYVFLSYVIDGQLKITENGEEPSSFALDNSPMDLDQQKKSVVQDVLGSSTVIADFQNKVKNMKKILSRARSTSEISFLDRLNAIENGELDNKPDLSKIIVE